MKVQCNYCNSWINDTDEKCPHCGGTNKEYKRTTDKTPKTIAELQKWYEDHHLPPQETTRFFIGVNYKKPRAFGIYRNGKGEFVVYKNKDNGQRAIRYQGTDEAYAVNELYQKLKEEILNQKRNNQVHGTTTAHTSTEQDKCYKLVMASIFLVYGIFFAFLIGKIIFCCISSGHEGYYCIDDKLLYNYSGNWYEYSSVSNNDYDYYDNYNDYNDKNYQWIESTVDYNQYEDVWDYNLGKNYNDSAEWNTNVQSFTDSEVYEEAYEASHSSSDDGYSWDSGGSWDSGSTDWSSDW